jgi:hypothetical protein
MSNLELLLRNSSLTLQRRFPHMMCRYQPGNLLLKNGTAQEIIPPKKTNIWVIVGSILGVVFAALAVTIFFVVYCCVCKKRQSKDNLFSTTSSTGKTPAVELAAPSARGARPFSVAAIAAATQNFKREIGKGGFGPVYYGKLPNGQEVAVKVLDTTVSNQGASEFFNEVCIRPDPQKPYLQTLFQNLLTERSIHFHTCGIVTG